MRAIRSSLKIILKNVRPLETFGPKGAKVPL